jgi:hypothetical protein
MRRFTLLSARNLYPFAVGGILAVVGCPIVGWGVGELVVVPLAAPWVSGAASGHRSRQSDLGAGEELRAHELSRRWIWEPRRRLAHGERRFLGSQGELVHERAWPESLAYVSMTALRQRGPRLPLGAGQHVVVFGATGEQRRALPERSRGDQPSRGRGFPCADWPRQLKSRSSCSIPRIRIPTAGSRCGERRLASPPAPSNQSSSQSPTTTTSCAGTWTLSAAFCTLPVAGRRRCRFW